MSYGPFTLERVAGELRRDGAPVAIQPKAFDLLWVLVRSAGQIVTYDELMAAVWPGVHLSEDAVAQMVRRVRRALGDEGSWIESVPKRGYRARLPPGSSASPPIDGLHEAAERPGPLALTGSPGVGKTWQLRRLAARLDAHWIEASHIRDPDALGDTLLRAAGAPVDDPRGTLTAWARVAHRTGRPWAIDGVDGLVDALEPHLSALSHTGARVWLTTRQQPDFCRVWPVAPLDPDASLALLRGWGARGTPAELAAIAEKVGHVPLLLRLAAARTSLLAPGELLRRLGDPLHALGAPLEASLLHTWELLPPSGRVAWHQASLFTQAFSASTAEARGLSLDALDLLARWHLIESRDGDLRMPTAIAAFGRARRDEVPGGRDHLRAHAEAVRAEARAALDAYYAAPSSKLLQAFASLAPAWDAVIAWCEPSLPDLAHALRLLDGHRLLLCGPAHGILPRLLPVVRDGGPEVAWEAGWILRPADAAVWVPRIDERLHGVGPAAWIERAWAVATAGTVPPDLPAAWDLLRRGRATGDPLARHHRLLHAARHLATYGAVDAALGTLRGVEVECLAPEAARRRASATLFLGNLYKMRGDLDTALVHFEEGCRELAATGSGHTASRWRVNIANTLALIPERRREAITRYADILEQAQALLDRESEGLARISLGVTWMTLDRYDQAEAALRSASGLEGPQTFPASRLLFHLASVARRRGDPETAIAYGRALLAMTDADRQDRAWGRAELEMALADADRPGSEPVTADAWGALVQAHRAWAALRHGQAGAADEAFVKLALAEARAGKGAPATLTHAIAWLRARLGPDPATPAP